MPELPEVETIKRQLSQHLPGLTLRKLKIFDSKTGRYLDSAEIKKITGKKIKAVERIAKVLLLKFVNDYYLAFHLKMTGQVILNKHRPDLPDKYTRAVLEFSQNTKLYFQDLRKFGWLKILNAKEIATELMKTPLGPEPFSKKFSLTYFRAQLAKSHKPIKIFLLDQSKLAGVGNIYANESLWLGKINPKTKASDLKPKQTQTLYTAIKAVLQKGIKYGGASDNSYLNAFGLKGQYQEHFLVYRRTGQKCSNCGSVVKRITLGGRGTFYCPKCQK